MSHPHLKIAEDMHLVPRLADVPNHVRAMLRTASEDSLAVAGDWLEESAAAGAFVRAVGREDAISVMRLQAAASGDLVVGYAVVIDGVIISTERIDADRSVSEASRFKSLWGPAHPAFESHAYWTVTLRGEYWRGPLRVAPHTLRDGAVDLLLPIGELGLVRLRARCTGRGTTYDRFTGAPRYSDGVYRGIERWRAAFR